MSVLRPELIPENRDHLDHEDRRRLRRFELMVAAGRYREAQDLVEELWLEAIDSHKQLYQGLSNAVTAICAATDGKLRGAREIADATHQLLHPFPRRALGIDLDGLVELMEECILS